LGSAHYQSKGSKRRKMVGQVSHEVEVNVPASEAWELYGTLRLSKLVEEVLSNFIEKIEVIEGDGGAGTIIQLTFAPGITIDS
jgi:hypothetical protein